MDNASQFLLFINETTCCDGRINGCDIPTTNCTPCQTQQSRCDRESPVLSEAREGDHVNPDLLIPIVFVAFILLIAFLLIIVHFKDARRMRQHASQGYSSVSRADFNSIEKGHCTSCRKQKSTSMTSRDTPQPLITTHQTNEQIDFSEEISPNIASTSHCKPYAARDQHTVVLSARDLFDEDTHQNNIAVQSDQYNRGIYFMLEWIILLAVFVLTATLAS